MDLMELCVNHITLSYSQQWADWISWGCITDSNVCLPKYTYVFSKEKCENSH